MEFDLAAISVPKWLNKEINTDIIKVMEMD